MEYNIKEYIINIIDDPNYNPESSDNVNSYDLVYSGIDLNSFLATSQHGIRIFNKNQEGIKSAIVRETGGATTIHDKSCVLTNDYILLCCCDKVYSLTIPELQIIWHSKLDPATCFAIYPYNDDYIVHGELQITRIDKAGNEIWNFYGKDIFVTSNDKHSFEFIGNKIKLIDWEENEYILNEDGKEVGRV